MLQGSKIKNHRFTWHPESHDVHFEAILPGIVYIAQEPRIVSFCETLSRRISDVKRAAIRLDECDFLNLQDILGCCGFSESTWYRVWKFWRDVVSHPTDVRGRVRHLDCEDVEYLLQLVHDNPDYFLDEFANLTRTNRSLHFTTVFNKLERLALALRLLHFDSED